VSVAAGGGDTKKKIRVREKKKGPKKPPGTVGIMPGYGIHQDEE